MAEIVPAQPVEPPGEGGRDDRPVDALVELVVADGVAARRHEQQTVRVARVGRVGEVGGVLVHDAATA